MTKLCFFDTETTGLADDAKIVQLAYRLVEMSTGELLEQFNELYNPEKPIDIGAMAVCHITNKMVADKPLFNSHKDKIEGDFLDAVCIAHNAKYDTDRLKYEGFELPKYVIDTKKVAQYLLQDEENIPESYSMQYLRYFLDLQIENSDSVVAHDALGDIIVLESLFWCLVNLYLRQSEQIEEMEKPTPEQIKKTINRFIQVTREPLTLRHFPFGKHKGVEFKDVPLDYLQWAVRSLDDIGEDLQHTISLALRGEL